MFRYPVVLSIFGKNLEFPREGLDLYWKFQGRGANLLLEIPWERDNLCWKFHGEGFIKMGFLDRGVRIKTAIAHLPMLACSTVLNKYKILRDQSKAMQHFLEVLHCEDAIPTKCHFVLL